MSGVVKGIKKVVKGVGRFVKKYWKPILAVAAVGFTAGLATVGTAGFAAAGGGSGFVSTLGAIGKTMVAGVQAIGGSLGIGKGANLAAFGGTGTATLGTGAAAQALGFAPTGAAGAGTAANLAAGIGAGGVGPTAALANVAAPSAVAPAVAAGLGAGTGAGAAGAAGAGGAGSFLTSPLAGVLMQGGLGLMQGYQQARMLEEQEPRGAWGVDLRNPRASLTPQDFVQPRTPMWSADSWGGGNSRPMQPSGGRPAPALAFNPNDPNSEEWRPERGYFGG